MKIRSKNLSFGLTWGILLVIVSLASAKAQSVEVKLFTNNSLLTVTGTDFGTPPQIAVHDDFESGQSGQILGGWELGSSHGAVPVYTDATSVSGYQSGVSSFRGENYNSTAEYKNLGGLREIYLSYYFKIERISGDRSRNIKLARLSSGYSSGYQAPMTGITSFASNGNGIVYLNQGGGQDMLTTWTGSFADGQWHRAEHHIRLSSYAGAKDGEMTIKIDGESIVKQIDIATEMTGNSFEWLTLPYFVSHSPGGDYDLYYDNVHLSNNQARVELCDARLASECSTPIVVNVSSWKQNEITIDLQQVDLSSVKYLYVYDNNGELLNQSGALICSQCPSSPTISIE